MLSYLVCLIQQLPNFPVPFADYLNIKYIICTCCKRKLGCSCAVDINETTEIRVFSYPSEPIEKFVQK